MNKDFYVTMEYFEKFAKSELLTGSMGFEKEKKELWKIGQYYCDSIVNNAFKWFLKGSSFGKAYFNNN